MARSEPVDGNAGEEVMPDYVAVGKPVLFRRRREAGQPTGDGGEEEAVDGREGVPPISVVVVVIVVVVAGSPGRRQGGCIPATADMFAVITNDEERWDEDEAEGDRPGEKLSSEEDATSTLEAEDDRKGPPLDTPVAVDVVEVLEGAGDAIEEAPGQGPVAEGGMGPRRSRCEVGRGHQLSEGRPGHEDVIFIEPEFIDADQVRKTNDLGEEGPGHDTPSVAGGDEDDVDRDEAPSEAPDGDDAAGEGPPGFIDGVFIKTDDLIRKFKRGKTERRKDDDLDQCQEARRLQPRRDRNVLREHREDPHGKIITQEATTEIPLVSKNI